MGKKVTVSIVLCVLLLVPAFIFGQVPENIKSAYETIDKNDLEALLTFVASDYTEGRETTSKGFDIAAQYMASIFKFIGLKPGGDTKITFPKDWWKDPDNIGMRVKRYRSYFQVIPFEKVIGDPESYMAVKTSGKGYDKEVLFNNQTHYQIRTNKSMNINTDIVFIGYGRDDEILNDFKGVDIRDKIVVYFQGMPGFSNRESGLYKKYREKISSFRGDRQKMTEYQQQTANMLKEKGVLGSIQVAARSGDFIPEPVSKNWLLQEQVQKDLLNPSYEGDEPMEARPNITPKGLPSTSSSFTISASKEVVDAIFEGTGFTIEELQKKIDESGKSNSFVLKNKKIRIVNKVRTEIVTCKNVIGYIEGSDSELKNEVIVVGAHLDHLGKRSGLIFNGADDNASGSVGVTELAEAFLNLTAKPKRTIFFCLWTGEEHGLYGSKYFTEHIPAPYKRENIVMNYNWDMIGRFPKEDNDEKKVTVSMSIQVPELKTLVEKHNETVGLPLDISVRDVSKPFGGGGSDHMPFAKKDIPIIYMDTGFHADFHQPSDHVDLINFDAMEKIVKLGFLIVNEVANMDKRFNFDKSLTENN